ncbi:MAG TPA: 4-hydroxy-tetrahydrodipicolinate synthase [Bacteroidales bacterium]
MEKEFKGTGVAIITPFTRTGKIDFNSLGNLVEHIIVNKVEFVVALGTTGEASTLSHEEQQQVVDAVKKTVAGRVPVVVGIGGNNTQKIVDKINETDFNGIQGILSVAPYYNLPNQQGMYEHFSAIAKACPVPVIMYNIPGRSAANISAETIITLAEEHWNIVAVKEASGNMKQIMTLLRNKPEGFSVLSGDDALTYPMMALGADGVISVVANVYPAAFSGMVRLMEKKKFDDALAIHNSLMDFIEAMLADGNPAGVKAALSKMKMCQNYVRLPLVTVNKEVSQRISKLIENYEFPLD